ncbi:hypothetical protein ACFX13_031631 [Malus domestica]|nr:SWI/SNF complex subunit SWI3B-like [Malus domestica]
MGCDIFGGKRLGKIWVRIDEKRPKTSSDTPSKPPPTPLLIPANPETPTTAAPHHPQLHPTSDADVIHVLSYSSWFSPYYIHHCEVRFLPEFFDSRSPSKNPSLYEYYHNTIITESRAVNPSLKLTFTEPRKSLVGDISSVRRVFDFLEAWGLINYVPSALNKPLKWEDSSKAADVSSNEGGESLVGGAKESPKKKTCNGCKFICSIASTMEI